MFYKKYTIMDFYKQKQKKKISFIFPIVIGTYILLCFYLLMFYPVKDKTPDSAIIVYKSEEELNRKTNINTATKRKLIKLEGIDEILANRIIQYREENGEFKSIEEIMNIYGIGKGKFNAIKDKISVTD